jgi:hypothetical protein
MSRGRAALFGGGHTQPADEHRRDRDGQDAAH